MAKQAITCLFLAIWISSCGPVTAAPIPSRTGTPPATLTLVSTPTELRSPTPSPVPQTNEHFLVTRDQKHWVSLNADGSLQKYIQVPDFSVPTDVSPDGKWLAYESGSYKDEPHAIALHLLNLDDGTSQFVTNLVSPDFPENLDPIVDSMSQYDPSLYGNDCMDTKCRRSLVEGELLSTVGIFRWSPDSQFLSFAAQIDGPSTDIYIYNMREKTIRRLTDDLQNVEWMEWSPDGKRLLYTNDLPGIVYSGRTFHVTDLEGRSFALSKEILTRDSQWYIHGWISNNLCLLQALYPEPGQRHERQLLVANIENGQLTEIWPFHTNAVAIDISNQTIILSFAVYFFDDPIPNAPEQGTYVISTNGDRKRISDRTFSPIISSSQIIGIDGDERAAYHIRSDGSIKRIGATDWGLANSSSPNKKWFFLEQEEREGIQKVSLYDHNDQQIKSWMIDGELIDAAWRPDSLGIFLLTEDNIYYLDIPGGEPKLLNVEVPPLLEEGCGPRVCTWPSFAWRP